MLCWLPVGFLFSIFPQDTTRDDAKFSESVELYSNFSSAKCPDSEYPKMPSLNKLASGVAGYATVSCQGCGRVTWKLEVSRRWEFNICPSDLRYNPQKLETNVW